MLWVAIWPAATTIFLVLDHGHWSNYLVLLGLVLAYGATITSLGLALATWVSRLGRAIALCVTAYVALVIGWPMLLVFGLGNHDDVILALILGDPLYGSAFVTMAASSGPLHLPGDPPSKSSSAGGSSGSWSTPWPRRCCSGPRWPRSTAAWAGSPRSAAARPPAGPAGRRRAPAELLALVPLPPRTSCRMGDAHRESHSSHGDDDWGRDRCSRTSG